MKTRTGRLLTKLVPMMVLAWATVPATSRNADSDPEPVYYHGPQWSPDGKRIAFYSNLSGNFDVYTVGVDGTDLRRLTDHEKNDTEMCWSPSGRRIAFASNRGGRSAIYLMNADGSGVVAIGDTTRAQAPAWSPYGTHIAFEGRVRGNHDIFVMDADGTNVTRLTNHEANDFRPTWSRDGKRIAFTSKRSGNYDLYVMNADGSGVEPLTETDEHETTPRWSPRSDVIIFAKLSTDEEPKGLHVLDLGKGKVTRLTSGTERAASWSPDGKRIVFVAGDRNNMAIYTMDAIGTNRRELRITK